MGSPSPTKVVTAVVVAVVVLGGALSVCVVFGPAWIAGNGSGLSTADRVAAENDVRSTLLQGFGGLLALGGVAVGAVMTLRQVRANREGHSIDLFTKAIDQLASDQVSVRHGGVYALEQLSELDARYRGHAHALLTAFVRRHAPWPPATPGSGVPAARTPVHGGVADDVGAALAVLSRRAMIVDGAGSELESRPARCRARRIGHPSGVFRAFQPGPSPPHRRQARRGHPVRRPAARDRPVGC